jgi:hypothetical protein
MLPIGISPALPATSVDGRERHERLQVAMGMMHG